MRPLMNKLNQFFEIAAKSECYLDIKDINKAHKLREDIQKSWDSFRTDYLCLKIQSKTKKKTKTEN